MDKKDIRNCFLLVLLGAICFLPFLGAVHLFDWDEINFAEASREMIETGNYMRVTIDYQPFWEKPPLFFWLQVMSMKMWGVNEFAARFVNAVFGILTLLVAYIIGKKLYDRTFGFLWAATFAGSFLPHFFFKSGIIDPVFNLFIFLSITLIASGLLSSEIKRRLLMFGTAGVLSGLAVLSKGPVAFLMIAFTIFIYWALQRFRKEFSLGEVILFMGTMCFTAAVFYGIETIFHGTWFIREFLRYQIRLFSTGDAGHGRPFYFHFLVILFGCFPASFMAIRSFTKRHEPVLSQRLYNRIMIILFWVVLITFSIVKTKTVLYSSLAWFPVTYLSALTMYGVLKGALPWGKWLNRSLIAFSTVTAAAIAVFPVLIINKDWITPIIKDRFAVACLQRPVHWSGFEFLVGVLFFAALIVSFVLISRRNFLKGFASLLVSCALCCEAFMIVFTPKIEEYTQRGPVDFYKEHSSGDVYVRSLFKSYADLYYGKKRMCANPKSHDREWLLKGDIDKPVYFVGRITQEKKYSAPEYGLTKIKEEHGFVYYRRDPPQQAQVTE